tara:strand:+ start:3634 stop:4023 length:390 start_codon:yes stop_codon:yes gene_type:complete
MSEKFPVEIISPDKSILKTDAIEVNIPSYEGEMGILKDHISLITFLRPGLIILNLDNKKKTFFVEDGIVEFSDNKLLILTSTAKSLDDFEKNSIDQLITDSQKLIEKNEISDKERYLLSYKIDTLKALN